MNREQNDDKILDQALNEYFHKARQVKCPKSMKQNLYAEVLPQPAFSGRLAFAGIASAAFVLFFSHSIYQQNKLNQAEKDLNTAMHYIQKMTYKSLGSVNTNGIQPAVIKPLAKSVSSI